MEYQERTYRGWVRGEGLVCSKIAEGETDLMILAARDVSGRAMEIAHGAREELSTYIMRDGEFQRSLSPRDVLPDAPAIAKEMARASAAFGVGPMAAVAGAIAARVGRELSEEFGDVIVENGGDIFVASPGPVVFGFYAGEGSPFTGKLRFRTTCGLERYGVCTSSGTVGHSLSFGRADALCVLCEEAAEADAAATALANLIKEKEDVGLAVDEARRHPEILGIIAAKDDRIGIWGKIEVL
ncbi:MAG TPA: UPF0280 family protein [bacterium]|nr:UPF0280 family protein [bacterium]